MHNGKYVSIHLNTCITEHLEDPDIKSADGQFAGHMSDNAGSQVFLLAFQALFIACLAGSGIQSRGHRPRSINAELCIIVHIPYIIAGIDDVVTFPCVPGPQ